MPLEDDFHRAMIRIAERARDECRYDPRRFVQMISEYGASETARRLLHSDQVPDGFLFLLESGRTDLSMEKLILEEKWTPLFTEEERRIARRRLGME
jgi:hypothetical protein